MTGTGPIASILGVLLSLLLVLALAWGFIRALAWWQAKNMGGAGDSSAIRFVRAMPLGPRERAVLLDVEGERFLLGVAAGAVTLLARWPAAPVPAEGADR
jgi:flagellar protein FliO/FliZ